MRRLKEIVRRRGGAQRAAELSGVPIGTLQKDLSGQTKAAFGTVMAIIEALEIDPAQIFPGKPPKKTLEIIQESQARVRSEQARRRKADGEPQSIEDQRALQGDLPDNPAWSISALAQPGMIAIPRYDEVRPSAGPGAVATDERPSTRVAFEQRWLTDIGVQPSSAVILAAQGDSMEPTIRNGSPMLVDTSKTEVRNGFIYVIAVEDDLLVKRVRRRLDGVIELISDNSAYAPEALAPDRLSQLRVIGRVYAAVSKF